MGFWDWDYEDDEPPAWDPAPRYAQATNVLYAIILPTSLFISIFYYTLVWDGELRFLRDIGIHILNSLIMIVDAVLNAQRIRYSYIVYPLVFSTLYTVFNYVLFLVDFVNIPENCGCEPPVEGCRPDGSCNFVYAALNWNMLDETVPIVIFAILVGGPVLHTVGWALETLTIPCCARVRFQMKNRAKADEPKFVRRNRDHRGSREGRRGSLQDREGRRGSLQDREGRRGSLQDRNQRRRSDEEDALPTVYEAVCESCCASPSPDTGAAWASHYAGSLLGDASFSWLITRAFLLVAWTVILILHILSNFQGGLWFVFVTNWAQLVEFTYLVMAFYTTFKAIEVVRMSA